MARISKEELLQRIFKKDFESLKGKTLRMTRLRIPSKEVCMAHILTPTDYSIYRNLGLDTGTHEGEDHTGESIGLLSVTPWESVIIAADTAKKSGNVEIGFMDRFDGELIITGELAEVKSAITKTVEFFKEELGFEICEVFEN